MQELRGGDHGHHFGGNGGSQSHEGPLSVGIPSQPCPRGTSSLCGQTLTLDCHPGSISGDGRTILSVSGQTFTLGRHSRPDPVGIQAILFGDDCAPTSVLHFISNLVGGQTVFSGCGQTPISVRHLRPDPDNSQTVHLVDSQTVTSVH